MNVLITGPKNPKTSDRKYKKMPVNTRVRVNLQATRCKEAPLMPSRKTSSFHMNSILCYKDQSIS